MKSLHKLITKCIKKCIVNDNFDLITIKPLLDSYCDTD